MKVSETPTKRFIPSRREGGRVYAFVSREQSRSLTPRKATYYHTPLDIERAESQRETKKGVGSVVVRRGSQGHGDGHHVAVSVVAVEVPIADVGRRGVGHWRGRDHTRARAVGHGTGDDRRGRHHGRLHVHRCCPLALFLTRRRDGERGKREVSRLCSRKGCPEQQ